MATIGYHSSAPSPKFSGSLSTSGILEDAYSFAGFIETWVPQKFDQKHKETFLSVRVQRNRQNVQCVNVINPFTSVQGRTLTMISKPYSSIYLSRKAGVESWPTTTLLVLAS
jgi:hypothetical protein